MVVIVQYVLWWDKPLNVQEPVDVSGRTSAIIREQTDGLHDAWSIFVKSGSDPHGTLNTDGVRVRNGVRHGRS
jgi:hypothetical protein